MDHRGKRLDWAVFAAYWLLALLFSWPLPLNAAGAIMGDGKDGWMETWNLWWVGHAITSGSSPYHFTGVFAPDGVTDYLHALNPLGGTLTLPLQWLFGASFAYNVACWGALALTAFGGYLLGRDITGSRAAGFVGGLAFGFAPHQFAQLLSHLSVASVQFFVLGVWCLYRGVQAAGKAWAAWALWGAAFLAASALTHFYTTLFQAGTLLLLGLLWSALPVLHARRPARWKALATAVVVVALGLVVTSGLLAVTARQANDVNAPGRPDEGTTTEIGHYSADLAAYVLPSPFHPLWGDAAQGALYPLQGTLIEKVVFPGYLVVALALLGAISPLTRRRAGVWLMVALVGMVLSFGPSLHVGGTDLGVPMPGALFYMLPLSSLMRVPARFSLVFDLGLSVCAALGITALLELLLHIRWRPLRAALAPVAVALLLFELVPVPFPTSTWVVDPWYKDHPREASGTGGTGGAGAVLEVPFDQFDTRPLASQIVSGLQLAGGYLSRMPVYALSRGVPPFTDFGLDLVPGTPLPDPPARSLCSPTAGSAGYLDILRLANVRYVALHLDRLAPDDPRISLARRLFPGGPAYSSASMLVYDTGGAQAPASLLGAVEDTVDWGDIEAGKYVWASAQQEGSDARIHFWSGADLPVRLQLSLVAFGQTRDVRFTAGGTTLTEGRIAQTASTFELSWTAPRGFSTLVISVSGPAVTPASLGLGADNRPLTFGLTECKLSTR